MSKLKANLIILADKLDNAGLTKEADMVDFIIKKAQIYEPVNSEALMGIMLGNVRKLESLAKPTLPNLWTPQSLMQAKQIMASSALWLETCLQKSKDPKYKKNYKSLISILNKIKTIKLNNSDPTNGTYDVLNAARILEEMVDVLKK